MKTDNVAIYYEKKYNTKQYNWYYQDIKDGFFRRGVL